MTKRQRVLLYFVLSICVCIILSSCNEKKHNNNYYLHLTGESETWNLTGYEVYITSENFSNGNGILQMKRTSKYISDFFSYKAYMRLSGEPILIQSHITTGDINIAQKELGTIKSDVPYTDNNKTLILDDISEIYMIVTWFDQTSQTDISERIDLYKQNKSHTSLIKKNEDE